MSTSLHDIGAHYSPQGSKFILWSPGSKKVELELGDDPSIHPMDKDERGYWQATVAAAAGTHYRYRIDEKESYPDPASLALPSGVHGPSLLVDRSFSWTDDAWVGMPLSNMIIYELHTGCFSDTHDFEGITRRLDYLAELGINTIELMPLGQFPGRRNWGYDGVSPFAVQHSYGGILGFQRLVDAAHAKGIAVIVDVVYNHLGPEGNYLPAFGPYFSEKYRTPWGAPLNFDGPWSDGVRNYFLQNARMWLEDYRADGLRVDAVHAIYDFSARHFMQEMKELALEIESRTSRKKVLIAEIDLNDPRYINPVDKGGYGLDGQWIDEFHHSLRTLMTGERKAYFEDFGKIEDLEKAFRETYVYNGNWSQHRKRCFGGRIGQNPYSQFVVFSQNHDQVGNRAFGDRPSEHLDQEQLKLLAATVLLSPYIPMLFMGEEYGEKNPFQFFTEYTDEKLIEGVRKGRAAEFPDFAGDHELPDPQAEETFLRSHLSWDYQDGQGAVMLRYYKHLLRLRKTRPAMQGMQREDVIVHPAEGSVLCIERKIITDHISIYFNYGGLAVALPHIPGRKIFDSAAAEWGGPGQSEEDVLLPYSAVIYEKTTI